ncbi:MAG: benzoate-CoA ligase family protein [Deltaproteobacteria bacterium]|nr:benzoate-CoA ligase family protein [Deltaproteobacteria bacterium]
MTDTNDAPDTEPFNAADWFVDRNVREGRGRKVVLRTRLRDYTYDDLLKMVNKTANALRDLGVRIEDRVAMALLDIPQFYAVFLGAIRIGAVPIPLSTMMTARDFELQLNDSRARVFAVSEELDPVIHQIRGDLPHLRDLIVISQKDGARIPFQQAYRRAPSIVKTAATTKDDPGFWLYSSGSTGAPKGVVHAMFDMTVTARNYGQGVLGLTEDDVVFSASKLFFAYGLGNSLSFPLAVGASAVLCPERPTPETVLSYLRDFRPTVFFAVPTLYAALLDWIERREAESGGARHPDAAADLSSVRRCVSAGEALPADLFHRWKTRFGLEILDGIGSTELLHIFLSNRPGDARPGSTGKPVPGYELQLVDEAGRPVAQGDVGSLLVKGGSAARLYWHRPEKTRSTMVGEWTATGDKYHVDADGFWWCSGRGDDMLKVGGIWVSPVEVESAVCRHPAVLECAVVGQQDEHHLVKPKAFVVLRQARQPSEALAEEIKALVKSDLAAYKYPRWIEFVPALPKSATGKIQRFRLRA